MLAVIRAHPVVAGLAVYFGVVTAGLLFCVWTAEPGPNEYTQWCGCDGEGMAHVAGARGFACEVKS